MICVPVPHTIGVRCTQCVIVRHRFVYRRDKQTQRHVRSYYFPICCAGEGRSLRTEAPPGCAPIAAAVNSPIAGSFSTSDKTQKYASERHA